MNGSCATAKNLETPKATVSHLLLCVSNMQLHRGETRNYRETTSPSGAMCDRARLRSFNSFLTVDSDMPRPQSGSERRADVRGGAATDRERTRKHHVGYNNTVRARSPPLAQLVMLLEQSHRSLPFCFCSFCHVPPIALRRRFCMERRLCGRRNCQQQQEKANRRLGALYFLHALRTS